MVFIEPHVKASRDLSKRTRDLSRDKQLTGTVCVFAGDGEGREEKKEKKKALMTFRSRVASTGLGSDQAAVLRRLCSGFKWSVCARGDRASAITRGCFHKMSNGQSSAFASLPVVALHQDI